MLTRGVAVALATGTLLALVAPADAKIALPLGGAVLHAGQQIELRVPGCSSSKQCRWAADTRIVLSVPSRNMPPRRTIARLGTVSRYGMLRFSVPKVTTGTYVAVAIWPHARWARTTASAPFTITS